MTPWINNSDFSWNLMPLGDLVTYAHGNTYSAAHIKFEPMN